MSQRFADLDAWPTSDAVMAMFEGQLAAAAAVNSQVEALAQTADEAADRLRESSGRIVYVGAGTSGRLAVLDGVELGPTFDWSPERLLYGLAGGMDALTRSVENAEDDADSGRAFAASARLNRSDVVIGVSASGSTPFTLAAVREASSADALTIAIASNAGAPLLLAAEHPILLDTGPELVSGSTRMKAGTAQKVALNLLSTAVMLKLGRVYKGLMVDMRPSNQKLRSRAISTVAEIGGVDAAAARAALEQAGDDIKVASLLAMGMDIESANRCLAACGDNLRVAIDSCGDSPHALPAPVEPSSGRRDGCTTRLPPGRGS